jgi:hypothetical protein
LGEEQLRTELEALRTAPDYRTLKPVVEGFVSVLNVAGNDPFKLAVASEGLRVIKALRQQFSGSVPSKAAIENATAGLLNLGSIEADKIYNVAGGAVFNIVMDNIKQMPTEPSVEVAFILLAMTKAQADQLVSLQAFQQQPDILKQNFDSLSAFLADIGEGSWPNHYGTSPEDWRPRGGDSIAQLVGSHLDALNVTKEFKKLSPKFYSIEALRDVTATTLLRQLRRDGCLMIVDAISLRHPRLLHAYQRSLLDAFPNTSVLTVTPDAKALNLMRGMVHALQLNLHESEFQRRCDDILEDSCEVSFQLNPKWLTRGVRRISTTAAVRPSTIELG